MKQPVDVIFFSGQSNMEGETECLLDDSVIEGAVEYRYLTDSLIPLHGYAGENLLYGMKEGYSCTPDVDACKWIDDHITGCPGGGHTNMVPQFCKNYIAVTGAKVAAVHIAKGASEIKFWMPGNPGWDALCIKGHAGLDKIKEQYEIRHLSFVWLQGESDAILGHTKEYYKQTVAEFAELLKNEFDMEVFGMIRVGRFLGDRRDDAIIAAQDEICDENEMFLMLSTSATKLNEMEEYMNPFAHGHYSAKGQEYLGKEAGTALGKYVAEGK